MGFRLGFTDTTKDVIATATTNEVRFIRMLNLLMGKRIIAEIKGG